LESNVRGQGLSLGVEERGIPSARGTGVELVDVHLANTSAAGDFHSLGVPLGTVGLRNSEGASLVVTEFGKEERHLLTLRSQESSGGGELSELSLVVRSPSNTTNHLALARSNGEVELPRGGSSAELVGVDGNTVGNERTIATGEGLKESLTALAARDLTEEDLDGLRNTVNLLELLEPVPRGKVELAVEFSLSGRRRADAALTSGVSAGAKEGCVVRLIPDREATGTMLNKDGNNPGDELDEVRDLGVDSSRKRSASLADSLVSNLGKTPRGSNTSDGELNPETTSTSSLGQVDVAVKLFQRLGTTASVEKVEVEHRADASSTHSLDLVEGFLTLNVVGTMEDGIILSAELEAVLRGHKVRLGRLGNGAAGRNATKRPARADALDGEVNLSAETADALLTTADLTAKLALGGGGETLLVGSTAAEDMDVSTD